MRALLQNLIPALILILLSGCKPPELEPYPAPDNPNLQYFGFTLIDVFWDAPGDGSDKTNYADEIAPFSNLADILVIEPTDKIPDRLEYFDQHELQAVIHLHEMFFVQSGIQEGQSGVAYDLREDYKTRWDTFVQVNNLTDSTVQTMLGAFYLGEEPVWNDVSAAELDSAASYIKTTVPEIPILVVEAYPTVGDLQIPISVDWVGFDHYFIADPQNHEDFMAELNTIKNNRTRSDQKVMLILDSHWIKMAHGSSGISKRDMASVAANYYSLANSDHEVIGMLGYFWPGGFDFKSSKGARDLPANVQAEYERIGKAITRK